MASTPARTPEQAGIATVPKGLLCALLALLALTVIGYLMEVARLWQPNTDLSEDELGPVKEERR